MKYITFKRNTNDFTDILTNPSIKKEVGPIITWKNHLMIGIPKSSPVEGLLSYIILMFGDDIVDSLVEDFTPQAGVDYTPEKPNRD